MLNSQPRPAVATTVLPRANTTPEVVARCRTAALAFVNGADRWSKLQLAEWLSGAYSGCAGQGTTSRAEWTPVPLLEEIDERMVTRLLQASSAEVREVLSKIVADGGHAFGSAMRGGSLVRPCRDRSGQVGYLPTFEARRLTEMVLALVAADYLTRPSDYELELSVCRYCGVAGFDLDARTRGHCDRHQSGFFVRRGDTMVAVLPEGA